MTGSPARVPSPSRARPRLGILASHPIQYQAPLYAELARRDVVDLEVAFLSTAGAEPVREPSFGVTLSWDIDLLSGYRSVVLGRRPLAGKATWLASVGRWLRGKDIVVLHGHASPDTLLAVAACRALGVPYLLRGESHARPASAGWRGMARHLVAGTVVRGAAGALPVGQRNAGFYHRYAQIPHYPAPYSVDNDRFRLMSQAARPARADRLAVLGLDPQLPTVIFSGKLIPRKRPLDVIRAVERTGSRLNLLLLGDGPLRAQVRPYEDRLPVRCLGFVNQADLPRWYASGDMLVLASDHEPWGLVVNEGMACGLIPVVSDAVGCAADLVHGVGEVFPVGDVDALAGALARASAGGSRGELHRQPAGPLQHRADGQRLRARRPGPRPRRVIAGGRPPAPRTGRGRTAPVPRPRRARPSRPARTARPPGTGPSTSVSTRVSAATLSSRGVSPVMPSR